MTGIVPPTDPLDISPGSIAAYLQGVEGWSLVQDRPAMQVWTHGPNPSVDEVIHLPTDNTYDDYDDNLDRALRHLQRLHDWDSQQLATQILAARSDVLFIRASQYAADGSIPVREAQQLLDGAVDMVTAAARATYSPKGSFRGRLPDVVRDFVDDDVRMGHTQRGSFVITILTRLDTQVTDGPPANVPALGPPPEEFVPDGPHAQLGDGYIAPFGRQVMSTLASGLAFVHQATEQPGARDSGNAAVDLSEAVAAGVSAQLCEALGAMADQEGVQRLDLAFNWAPAEPAPHHDLERVVFDRPTVPVLRDLRERLAPTPPDQRLAAVLGYVVRLERGQDAEEGAITVEGTTDTGDRRSVRIVLAGRDYATAVAAHNARGPVEARGTLRREGRRWTLSGNVVIQRVTVTAVEEE